MADWITYIMALLVSKDIPIVVVSYWLVGIICPIIRLLALVAVLVVPILLRHVGKRGLDDRRNKGPYEMDGLQ